MKLYIMALAILGMLIMGAALPMPFTPVLDTVVLAQQPSVPAEIDVDIGGGGEAAWFTNPVFIAVAVIAVVALVVALTRGGGGTTVVKD
jgi:hypothetical protein